MIICIRRRPQGKSAKEEEIKFTPKLLKMKIWTKKRFSAQIMKVHYK